MNFGADVDSRLPSRETERSESEDPSRRKSSVLTLLPKRAVANSENADLAKPIENSHYNSEQLYGITVTTINGTQSLAGLQNNESS